MRKIIIIITIAALVASFVAMGVVAYMDTNSQNIITPVDTSSSGTNQ